MKRQTLLLIILAALALVGVPVSYMDHLVMEAEVQAREAMTRLAPLRTQAAAVRQRATEVEAREQSMASMNGRLIGRDPFAAIQSELTAAARASGIALTYVNLEGPIPVPDLPQLVRYQAVVHVLGTPMQYLEFLRLLETHRLLIEIPEVSLRLSAQVGEQRGPNLNQVLTLGFFVAAQP